MIDPRIPYFYKTFYRVPFLVPYWDRSEMLTVLASSVGNGAAGGDPRDALKRVLAERFGMFHVVLTSSGRFAIELALRSLGRWGGEVIIPTFICSAVAEAVLAAGCVPVFADINDDLTLSVESVRANLTDNSVAVVVAHLSGKPARDLEDLEDLCQTRNLALIDDAAQAFGVPVHGRYPGGFGDFGVLSFGVGKPTFSIGGGALVTRSADLGERCEQIAARVGRAGPPHWLEVLGAWNFVLQYCCRRATQPAYLTARCVRKLLRASGRGSPRGRISRLAAALQLRQIQKLDAILAGFRAHGQYVARRLAGRQDVACPQASDQCAYTKLILRLDSGGVARLARHLLRRRVEIEWSYTPLELFPRYAALRRARNTYAATVWERLVSVPVHPQLDEPDMEYMVSAVESFLRAN